MKTCQPGYTLFESDDGRFYVRLVDESVIERIKTTV